MEKCRICGKESDSLNEKGLCEECAKGKSLADNLKIGEIRTALQTSEAKDKEFKEEVDGRLKELEENVNKIASMPIIAGDRNSDEEKAKRWAAFYRASYGYRYNKTVKGIDTDRELTPAESRELCDKLFLESVEGRIDEKSMKAAMQEDTTTEGGYLVPTPQDLIGEVIRLAEPASVALSDCQRIPMRSLTLPLTTEGSTVTVTWIDEEAAIGESEPTLGRVTLTAKKAGAYAIVSNELLADAAADVVNYINLLIGEAIGQELDNQVFNGTGSPCSGVLTAAAGYSVVMNTGSTNFSEVTGDMLSDMIRNIKPSALGGAKFYYHRLIEHYVRTLKDDNNNYIYSPIGGPQNATIWGMPKTLVEKCPSATAVDTSFVAFGNLKFFALGTRQIATMAIDPYGLFTTDQSRVRVLSRWGLSILIANAFVRLITAAA